MRLWDRGAITPGRAADIVLVDNIEHFQAQVVIVDGRVVAENGHSLWQAADDDPMFGMVDTVKLPAQRWMTSCFTRR